MVTVSNLVKVTQNVFPSNIQTTTLYNNGHENQAHGKVKEKQQITKWYEQQSDNEIKQSEEKKLDVQLSGVKI